MYKKLFLYSFMILCAAAIIFSGCSKDEMLNPVSSSSGSSSSDGKMGFAITLSHSLSIVSGTVTITKDAMTYQKPVTINDHQGSASFNDIQVGNWSISISLYDSDGIEIYTGTGTALVEKDDTTYVTVTVDENTGNLVINVDVPYADGLLLWNKLGSAAEVENSQYGPDGIVTGSVDYDTVQFDNGVKGDASGKYVKFPSTVYGKEQGCIECWVKMGNASGDVPVPCEVIWESYNTPSTKFIYLAIAQNKIYAVCTDGFTGLATADYSTASWNAGDIMHIAVVYDRSKSFDGSKSLALYINGVERASSTSDFDQFTNEEFYLCISPSSDAYNFIGYIDNLKIYDYPKIDFSDRFTE